MADWPLSGDGQYFKTYGADILSTDGKLASSSNLGADLYGAWVELTTSAGIDSHASGFIYTAIQSGSGRNYLVDIGIGAPGFQITIVQKLYFNIQNSAHSGGIEVYVPIAIPAGTRVWVRISANNPTTVTLTQTLTTIGLGFRPSCTFSKCVTYNLPGTVLDGESAGGAGAPVNFADPGTVASGTKVFVDITNIAGAATTLAYPISMALFTFVVKTADINTLLNRWYVDIGVGNTIGAPDYIAIPNIPLQGHGNTDRFQQAYFGPVPLSLPAGTKVQAGVCMAGTFTATRRELGIIMYGLS